MAIDGGLKRVYLLGRECVLSIEGVKIHGASDVTVRESVTEVDATGFNHRSVSTLVTHRTIELSVSIPDVSYAKALYEARQRLHWNGLWMPNIFSVSLQGGVIEFDELLFTIHDVDADEPLNGAVIPRFTFKQWSHTLSGEFKP